MGVFSHTFTYMKREIFSIIIGILLIIFGVFLLVSYQTLSLPLSDSSMASESSEPLWPKWINISKSKITVQVRAGGYENGKWILNNNFAFYLPTSWKLGEGGNTILYAHTRDRLFGSLKKTSVGDIIILGDANGKIYNYKVYSIESIKPYQVEKIETNIKDTITLFTCDGWFDEKRLVVKAGKVV